MTFGRIIAITMFAAVTATGTAQAQGTSGCRKTCDAAHSSCNRAGKEANMCLRGWHACKKQCAPAAAKAATTRLAQTPVRR